MSIAVGLAWYAQSQKECEELRAEIARLRLTDAELEAVDRAAAFADDAAGYCKNPANADAARKQAATLRGLLERLK